MFKQHGPVPITHDEERALTANHRTTNEQDRLAALYSLAILDTEPEPEFDELVQIAAAICGTPVSLISLLDEQRQWFKAAIGLQVTETSREVAFCDHAIRQPGLFLVEDATQDPRFAQNPMVTGNAGWQFYAGIPLSDPGGQAVGTLCVMDRIPRKLTEEQRSALRVLAAQVNARLELRVRRRELQAALAEAEAAKARLTASECLFHTFMDSVPFLGYLKDPEGRMLYYNLAMAQHFDVSRNFLLGKTDAELWPAELAKNYRQHDIEVLSSGKLKVTEERTQNPDRSASVWRSFKFPCADGEGRVLLGGVSIEITEERRRESELRSYQAGLEAANRRLQELASIDALTGLENRRIFDQRLKTAFRDARHSGKPLCLLLLDVDDFKLHNDRFGHGHGDEVLRCLGACFQQEVRTGDTTARYGGEEFAILLSDTTEEEATMVAERVLKAVRKHDWPVSPVTISIGMSTLSPATPDTQRLLTLADEALYAAKRAGKDRVISYAEVYTQALASARQGALHFADPSADPEEEQQRKCG